MTLQLPHELRSRRSRPRRREDFSTPAYPRLTQPQVRANGVLRPASWDEALDRAALAFHETIQRRGPEAIGLFSCSKASNEVNFLVQKFARAVLGTNNIDSCNRT
jgi:predicted molibdopterin-dependent oxidoreductase YjgC